MSPTGGRSGSLGADMGLHASVSVVTWWVRVLLGNGRILVMDGRDGLQWLGRDASELEGLMEEDRRFYESYDGREREGLRAFWMKRSIP